MSLVRIGSNLGIDAVPALQQQLLKHLPSKRAITIGVERIDRLHSAAMQVLCAFVRDRAAAGGQTRIDNAGGELRDAAQLLGVDGLLGLGTAGAAP